MCAEVVPRRFGKWEVAWLSAQTLDKPRLTSGMLIRPGQKAREWMIARIARELSFDDFFVVEIVPDYSWRV
jgi:hypothetical protein